MDTENQKTNTTAADEAYEEQLEEIMDAAAEIEKERDRKREQKKAKERAKKRRLIPPFMMLLAGAIISIAMYIMHYPAKDMLVVLLCVLIISYLVGEVFKWMLDRFEAQIEEARMEEGEVIEKEPEEEDATAKVSQSSEAGDK
ncbi:MAG: hypothetical protein NC318_05190 [Blautia sp.]|nr:hypothetical protein [Lachnoclostridium sp.]MCM1210978.1 hypothetical protein [Blautia sp.]